MTDCSHYAALAPLFEFPTTEYPARARAVRESLESKYPAAAARLQAFIDLLPGAGPVLTDEEADSLQEIFTRSFDVQSMTTLDVGYVMFGDDYKRAELMVNLNREHREAGIECGIELPDHLPNVLHLLGAWKDPDLVEEFVQEILHPALTLMVDEFEDKRVKARNALYKKHFKTLIDWDPERMVMYREALTCLLLVVETDFTIAEVEQRPETSQFLESIGREMDIEERGEGDKAAPPNAGNPNPPPTMNRPQPLIQLPHRRTP